MKITAPRRIIYLTAFLILVGIAASAAAWFAYSSALSQLSQRGRADLSLASDRLVSQLQRFRQVAVLLADHPQLVALTKGQGDVGEISQLLLATADKTGAANIMLASGQGQVLASSGGGGINNVSGQSHYERAMRGSLGTAHSRILATNQRLFYFASPIIKSGNVLGAVIVAVDMEAIEESDWRGEANVVFFTDADAEIFIANRSELLSQNAPRFKPDKISQFAGHQIWSTKSGPYIPKTALHLTKPLPVIGMTGEALIGTTPALRLARLQGAAVAAFLLALGAILFWFSERKRSMTERLELHAQVKSELESRVHQRSLELKQAQSDLVQAAKLAALGQMSAGISHELNQPLMAIRSFAENAEIYLQKDKPEIATQNLNRISELARRMGRIISNLRSFAKQESEPVTDVDIVAVVDTVLEMNQTRIRHDQVQINWSPPPKPIFVRGGEVRLQQVLVNLLTNAIDAMENSAPRLIEISVKAGQTKARLRVRDTGPGIKAPEKIFEPFYTTKSVGKPDGMGLGLSISYGLVQSFGGDIRGENHPDGGAIFTVELSKSTKKEAL